MIDPAFLTAIGNPTRFQALLLFETAPASARQLSEHVGLSLPATLYHVRVLRAAGLIEEVGTRRRRAFDERVWRTSNRGWHDLDATLVRLVEGRRDDPPVLPDEGGDDAAGAS
jgi:DNA-binding transcriptional ArsR family regulator